MPHHERIACSVCKSDVCMCRTVSKGPHFPYVCEDCANPPRPPITLLGIPVRVDATLCAPDEIWTEGPTGEAVRVWPKPEKG